MIYLKKSNKKKTRFFFMYSYLLYLFIYFLHYAAFVSYFFVFFLIPWSHFFLLFFLSFSFLCLHFVSYLFSDLCNTLLRLYFLLSWWTALHFSFLNIYHFFFFLLFPFSLFKVVEQCLLLSIRPVCACAGSNCSQAA